MYTDVSSTIGYGAYWAGAWFCGTWLPTLANKSIEWKELYTIGVACTTWGDSWAGKRVLFHCDNQAVTSVWDSGLSCSADLMKLVHSIFLLQPRGTFMSSSNICWVAMIPLLIVYHACRWEGFERCYTSSSHRYPHPCQSDRHLTAWLTRLQHSGIASLTRKMDSAGIRAYKSRHHISPILPASQLTLQYFVAELSEHIPPLTIKVYRAAVRRFHLEQNFEDPLKEALLLKCTCNGLKYSGIQPLNPASMNHHNSHSAQSQNSASSPPQL